MKKNNLDHSSDQLKAFAVCAKGLEESLVTELESFKKINFIKKNNGGASFNTDAETICRLNLWARIPSRILIQLGKTQVNTANELFDFALRIDWEEWFSPSNSFRVDVNSSGKIPKSMSTNYAALKFKDGMCDRFRSKFFGQRPTVNTKNPDIRVWIYFVNSLATVSIDTSGEPLFKRGWRQSKGIAPIKENLASALLLMTDWDLRQPLFDPMCGSGTFIIEAMQMITKIPPNFLPNKTRSFACENFVNDSPFANVNWKVLRGEALDSWHGSIKKTKNLPLLIGCDSSNEMIRASKENASQALPIEISESIVWKVNDINNYSKINELFFSTGVLVTNPPFGTRIEFNQNSKKEFIEKLGTILKKGFAGWTVWILTDEKKLSSIIKLRPAKKYSVFNGDISCNWQSFKMVTGLMQKKNGS